MKSNYWSKSGRTALCIGFILAILSSNVVFAATCENWVAEVTSVQGEVEAQKAGEKQWQPVHLNDKYCPGDKIRVRERSRADLALVNQPVLRLDQNTTITLGALKEKKSTFAGLLKGAAQLDLIKGAAHFFSRLPRNLEIRTAFVNAGVEGTEFFMKVDDNQTFITVFNGKVLAANDSGSLPITNGQSAEAKQGKAPVYRTVVHPRDAVQWALYYPPVIYSGTQGNLLGQEVQQDPNALVLQASQLLSVGRVDQAKTDIERALSLRPQFSDAFALQSIIAVVQNDNAKALALAQKAVEAGPQSATAQIALSYAQQANFDLESARKSVEKAVQLDPENALAWARLAELQSSLGYLDKSLQAAQKAVAIDPNLSRTQTVLGFAYLVQIKTAKAKDAFTKAIELDQADALPRLGLGLAKIREGQLQEGTREIEIAASLDANNSLIRSYMGKAYYEEKRSSLASREFDTAKKLDPKDPTPLFYEAIEKQTTNRPVEALQDLQKAIELNDNRAVYRSKLLLDSDLAARSASLARIYSDLGFQQRALVEGWNSVNTDPSNFSAHRFLADSYSALPRHEIARVSELLQSQLLQPNNITPIQPQLAESNLYLISSSGAADISFNEFNPLFNRDRVALQANGVVGQNGTWGGETVISGIHKKVSFSVGYTHFETDGFRTNNNQSDEIANIFLQWEITPKTSIQGEYRYRDNDRGDTQLRFFEDDFRPDRRQELDTKTSRLGFRHVFSPRSLLIGNFVYQTLKNSLFDIGYIDPADVGLPLPPPPPSIRADLGLNGDQDGYSGELSHLFRSQYINTVAGAGYFKINQDATTHSLVTYPGYPAFGIPPMTLDDTTAKTPADIDHTNLYLYTHIKPLENLIITFGASGDFYQYDEEESNANDLDINQFNPKFGISWNPVPDTTLRAAAFRTLKRTLITNQTLEPTEVAGFNQFFDDLNATACKVYGGAVDQKFSQSIYGGVEYFTRDLGVPWFDIPDPPAPPIPQLKKADWKEYLTRAYFYWTPHRWFALKGEYRYEKFKRDSDFNYSIEEVKTDSFPMAVNFSHPSGLNASLKGTYYAQKGKFMREGPIPVPYEEGSDYFWVVDATISYRLPKRHGFLTLGVSNLFDEKFQYADTDTDNPSIQPDRVFYGKVTLSIP